MVINLDPHVNSVREQYRRYYARQRLLAPEEQQGGLMDDVFYEDGQIGEGFLDDARDFIKRRYLRLPPIVRAGLKAAGRFGLSGLRSIAGDFAQGMNIKNEAKKRLSGASSVLSTMMGGRRRRRRGGKMNKKLLCALKRRRVAKPRRRRRQPCTKRAGGRRRKTIKRRRKTPCKKRKTVRRRQTKRKSTCGGGRRKRQQRGGEWLEDY